MEPNQQEKDDLLGELEGFYQQLVNYRNLASQIVDNEYTNGDWQVFCELRWELTRSSARLEQALEVYGGRVLHVWVGDKEVKVPIVALAHSIPKSQTLAAIDGMIYWTNRAIGRLQAPPLPEDAVLTSPASPPKAFIAHGGPSPALDKLCNFLRALGVVPLVAELQPSQGRLTEQQVDEQMSHASCAIILATYGYIVDARTSQRHPRLNVIDELGRCRRVFLDKIILLLEKRVELSSNVSGIVYERFVPQSMDKAFTKVAKELVAFGIIKAVKPG